MKKAFRCLFVLVLALCLTQAAALAADSVTVQVNGENMEFSAAAPQNKDGRVYLPVRAVFEQLGAELGYENGVVTATRGDTTITMTIGSTEAAVTRNGETEPLIMDVAPFIDPALGSTYVPVRFAAQALGANVGWDGARSTVLILDTESLLSGQSFTYLDKLLAHGQKYNSGIWDSTASMQGKLDVNLGELEPGTPLVLSVPVSVEVRGTTEDGTKLAAETTVKADATSLLPLLVSGLGEEDAETAAMLETLLGAVKTDGIVCAMRGDVSDGKLYLNLDPSALGDYAEALGLDGNTWYLIDMANSYAQAGLEEADLLALSKTADFRTLLDQLLASAELDDAEAAEVLSGTIRACAAILSDEAFTRDGDVCSTSYSLDMDGITLGFALSLNMKSDALAGYDIGFTLDAAEEAGALLDMKMGVDENDQLTGSLLLSYNGDDQTFSVTAELSGGYTRGTTPPTVTPPAEATVVNLSEMQEMPVDF